jgi:predicted helicase
MIKPSSSAIKKFFEARAGLEHQRVRKEMGLRTAFQALIADVGRLHKWDFVAEELLPGSSLRPDGTFRDEYTVRRGYWESKDTNDELDRVIESEIRKGYPTDNIIFEDSQQAVLVQDGREALRGSLSDAHQIATLLNQFFSHASPDVESFHLAVEEFKAQVPDLARGLKNIIALEYKRNKRYKVAFDDFCEHCRASLNPNIRTDAVEEMLIQHLLTERLIRGVIDNPYFMQNNVIAAEVEKVIAALAGSSFDRQHFVSRLDRFYVAIENEARIVRSVSDFAEMQNFLNIVYERFFQGFSKQTADTHGIVYTPQPIVQFMCHSVEEVLKSEFGTGLNGAEVSILDPCTGTGNFIVNVMRQIPARDLPRVYERQLNANEIMLLPYYVAALNIEHEYYAKTNEYLPFKRLCFVDTLDMDERAQAQLEFMSKENTERIRRQRKAPITVVIGNPPYNANQVNENDNNKNRPYKELDETITEKYARDSRATNLNKLHDQYVRFFRWATDRLRDKDGIVCLVTNNSFVDQIAFDGMRKRLAQEFSTIYHLDLHGNVYKNPKLSGTTHNVFGIKVGVGITVAVKRRKETSHKIFYHRVPEMWRKEEKLAWLDKCSSVGGVTDWIEIKPDRNNNWLATGNLDEFESLCPLGSKEAKAGIAGSAGTLFRLFSNGLKTNRDDVVYDFDRETLSLRIRGFIKDYNAEVARYSSALPEELPAIDEFVDYSKIDWSRDLKADLMRGTRAKFSDDRVRLALYRPYAARVIYFDDVLNEEVYRWHSILHTSVLEAENRVICVSGIGSSKSFHTLVANVLPDVHLCGDTQCFPFYVYNEDGTGRRENITDWALQQFRAHYSPDAPQDAAPTAPLGSTLPRTAPSTRHARRPDAKATAREITKWDIFYYVYGILHHPGYREKFADNLKRELPRIPFAPDFWAFADSGKRLAELHLDYEKIEVPAIEEGSAASSRHRIGGAKGRRAGASGEAPRRNAGQWIVNEDAFYSPAVEKMRLSKDKTSLVVNESLTLGAIPPEVYDYRLGNRSALEWVIDQYQIKTDKRSGIVSDPNREEDPEYIVRLVQQVIVVSLETVAIVKALPEDFGA